MGQLSLISFFSQTGPQDLESATQPDLVLVSCSSKKHHLPQPAQRLYRSQLFRKARGYVWRNGYPWAILSAEHGLVTPDQTIEPYDVTLRSRTKAEREAWSRRVAAQLVAVHGPGAGRVVAIHAGQLYANHLVPLLEAGGWRVQLPLAGLGIGERLRWYNDQREIPRSGATLTPDGAHCTRLWRVWAGTLEKSIVFVGLNPSTADADVDDPTIRRMVNFAHREGAGEIQVINLFTLRATDPKSLWATPALDRLCDAAAFQEAIAAACARADTAILCWGAGQATKKADKKVLSLAAEIMIEDLRDHGMVLRCFGRTKDDQPKHPLYLAADTPLVDWEGKQ